MDLQKRSKNIELCQLYSRYTESLELIKSIADDFYIFTRFIVKNIKLDRLDHIDPLKQNKNSVQI